MIDNSIHRNIQELIERREEISDKRRIMLDGFAEYISKQVEENREVNLIFICTHNSRRSHMSQIWAQTAAEYFGLSGINSFSGGTEVTAFNLNAVRAIVKYGFKVQKTDESDNPVYLVEYSSNKEPLRCFSKIYSDQFNPQENFIAVMTCSHAEENCPVVFGSKRKFSIQYEDPKIFDGTEFQEEKYSERFGQIGIEMLYTFSRIGKFYSSE